jgi:hypothetical protein
MLMQRCFVFFVAIFLVALNSASGAGLKSLPGHVPAVVPQLTPLGRVAATNQLHLAIGVSLRDSAGLEQYLARLYDPASPDYRHYLTPVESADRFGPSAQDYEAVKQFVRASGLAITGTFSNRLVLDVVGPVGAVEQAFHVTLRTYQHPTEARQFFAPDTEPAVAVDLPVTDLQGLSDFSKPHPLVKQMDRARLRPNIGSAPDGSGCFFGNDFRAAYVPGTALTGAGQSVGLFEFDGYYANDIATYAAAAGDGRTNIAVQTVLLDGYDGTPTTGPDSGNTEVSLDIEMAMSIAPGLSKIISFETTSVVPNDILNSMLSYSGTVKQLSSSWSWSGGPATTTDNIYKSMAAAGQSFFNAAGDTDAFTTGANSASGVDNVNLTHAPASSPYITQVGGTTLAMNGTGTSYSSETVWNWGLNNGEYVGSCGGISSYYSIPSWQTNITSLASRGGSTTYRNIPDVAGNADNVYVISGGSGGGTDGIGGTSCAAPLWAGFLALVNQQATAPPGFINPAIYALAATPSYSSCFHDVTTGNNTWPDSPSLFYATNGYDLCTGLGTPNGTALINALAPPSLALLVGAGGYAFSGPFGGPFTPASGAFVLTNGTGGSVSWSLINTSAWLTASSTGGTLASGAATSFTVSLAAGAGSLAVGTYTATITVSNQAAHSAVSPIITLQVYQPLSLTPIKGFVATGPVGGPFGGASQVLVLSNLTAVSQNWTLTNSLSWLAISSAGGSLPADGSVDLTASLAASANTLPAGIYNGSITLGDPAGLVAAVPFQLSVGQPNLQNGGFETGDFTGWTQSGNMVYTDVSSSSLYVHSGNYGAQLGSDPMGYLAQNLTTVPGQVYALSFWLCNPYGSMRHDGYGIPNQFQVQWNGATVYLVTNLTGTSWTNVELLVTATASTTSLQFGFEDTPAYLALDDISVTTLSPVSFESAVRAAGGFQLVLNTVTGLVYQVQYTTNLLSAAWMNLGSPTTANASTMTITDTNAVLSSPQRYYRLLVVP